jgi:hypothetical protein
MPDQVKQKLKDQIGELGRTQTVFHLYNNMEDRDVLHLESYIGGRKNHEVLAKTEGHGRWFEWKPSK